MATMSRSGSSRRKAEAPGKIKIIMKGGNSKVVHSDDENDASDKDNSVHMDSDENEVPEDLPEGTIVVQPEAVEDGPAKKKKEAPVRIDTSVLDNVNCTACGRQLNPYKASALHKHAELKVVICKRCQKFLSSGEIAKDKDGVDEQCRWCGEGGRLVVCDECSSAFCKTCVMRNFNRSEFNNINSQKNWKCYLCDRALLQSMRENYRNIRDTLKALQAKEKAKSSAAAVSNGTKQSEKSKSIQQSNAKNGPDSGLSKSKKSATVQKSAESVGSKDMAVADISSSTVSFTTEDFNVSSESVDVVMDKLSTATSTFKEMLRALRSQFHSTSPRRSDELSPEILVCHSSMNLTEKKMRCSKALNKGLITYFTSLKKILGEIPPSAVEDTAGSSLPSTSSTSTASVLTKSSSKSSSSHVNLNGSSSALKTGSALPSSTKGKTGSRKAPSQESQPEVDGAVSGSESDLESRIAKETNTSKKGKSQARASTVEKGASEKESRKSGEPGKEDSSKKRETRNGLRRGSKSTDKESEQGSQEGGEGVKSKEKKKAKEDESCSTPTVLDEEVPKENDLVTGNDTVAETSMDFDEENVAARFDLIQELTDELLKKNEEDDNGKSKDNCSDGDKSGDSDDELDLPVAFNNPDMTEENGSKTKKEVISGEKRKKDDSSSEEVNTVPKKKSKPITQGVKSKSAKPLHVENPLLSDISSDDNDKKDTDQKGKGTEKPDKDQPVTEKSKDTASDGHGSSSSSDLFSSDENDTTTTSQQKRKKRIAADGKSGKNSVKEKATKKSEKASKKTDKAEKIVKEKETKKAKKSKEEKDASTKPPSDQPAKATLKNGDTASDDDVDREIDKLAKLPLLRKRKAKPEDSEEDKEEEPTAEDQPEPDKKIVEKKSKPGPKCSKKKDLEDLSSDENEDLGQNIGDDEEEDDDVPPVTFFIDTTEDGAADKDEMNENEQAKNGMLEEMEDEKSEDSDNEDEDKDSSEEDSDVPTKSSKKKEKQEKATKATNESESGKEDDENADSEGDIGKKKRIKSKLLDTALSDSDSDNVKENKKSKKDDEDFEGKDSSDSSIESDLDDDDDEEDKSENDSDDEEEETKTKKKRKKRKPRKKKGKGSEEDEEENDSDEEGGKKKKKGKKRRRIKKMANSSDEDGESGDDDDDDDPNSSKTGKRKKIRKVMSNKKLEDSTRAAAKAEEKRRKRIAAKQREFNIETITDDNNPMDCPITTKLVLEPGKEEGDDPIVQVNKKLVRKLKPHQVEAVQFMWDCMFESVKRSKKEDGSGCILAHCMGLGKTLSVVSFVHTILSHEKVLKMRTCLVVSPLNTVLNWKNECKMWLDKKDQIEVWELASCKQNAGRTDILKEWQDVGGVLIIGYEMYRNLTMSARVKNKRHKKIFQETLVDPGPDIVVCDEGHILKNESSAVSKAMNLVKTRRRVVLTGTPLQNNLNEYHCMVNFVKPNLLGTRKEFTNRFINPIQNGQCTDSTPRDVKIMKARAHVLHEMLAGCIQRRDYSALTKFLPPKQEYVISVRLTNIQIELYQKYLELSGQGVDGIFTNKGARLFKDYQNLMKIWTHPWVLKLAEIRDELKVKYDDEDSFIDDDSEEERSFSSSNSSSEEDKKFNSDSGGEGTSGYKPGRGRGTRRTRAKARRQAGEDSDPEEVIAEWKSKTRGEKDGEEEDSKEEDRGVSNEWWAQFVTEDDKMKIELGNKLFLLFEILRMCEEIGDKVLIFSQSILSLNIIEDFLEVVDSKYQQESENLPDDEKGEEEFGRSWTKNLDYYRMDGSTSAQNRQMWAQAFNDEDNYRARLFIISTKAGGLGINLVAANRVIIFDASWNPSHDVQSIFRVYRFGQTKPCYIYRFLAQGTMEEKIYERQVTKLSLSQRVVDEHQIERHFSAADLKELYNFRPDRWDDGTEKPTLALPKDPLLAEILTTNKHCVVSFHEHDSLLENQVEQTLTEEEKKAAWEEYENEKKGIIIRGPGMESGHAASWPMMAAAQVLSREQITATVQALRQQLPDLPEDLFHLHVQQALRRQVQIKQEEMRRMELMRLQELNYMNMMKQQSGMSHSQSLQAMHSMQNMAPWMQMQRLRAMQNQMMGLGSGGSQMGMHHSNSMSMLGQALSNPLNAERISNKPEEAIDIDMDAAK